MKTLSKTISSTEQVEDDSLPTLVEAAPHQTETGWYTDYSAERNIAEQKLAYETTPLYGLLKKDPKVMEQIITPSRASSKRKYLTDNEASVLLTGLFKKLTEEQASRFIDSLSAKLKKDNDSLSQKLDIKRQEALAAQATILNMQKEIDDLLSETEVRRAENDSMREISAESDNTILALKRELMEEKTNSGMWKIAATKSAGSVHDAYSHIGPSEFMSSLEARDLYILSSNIKREVSTRQEKAFIEELDKYPDEGSLLKGAK